MSDLMNIFIQQNRHVFDSETPGAHGWKSVEKALERLPEADGLEKYLLVNRILMDTAEAPEGVWTGIEKHLNHAPKKSSLESFLAENRDALDSETPDLRVWSTISSALPAPKAIVVKVNWQRHLMRVAASVALLVVGLGAGIWYARSSAGSPGMAMADVSPEYAELEQYYKHDITDKKAKLASFNGSQSADVFEDLDQLDHIMEELRRDLATVPPGNRQQVVRAMIENYKAKAAILQRVLEHLGEQQNEDKNSKTSHEIKNI